jgi:hypothetical protein
MPRVKMSRADCNPWLAKMILEEEVLYAIAISETSFINHAAVNPRQPF